MDAHIKSLRSYETETSFTYCYICTESWVRIVQKVKELTDNEVVLGPGTIKWKPFEDGEGCLIHFIREEDKRKIYEITELGTEVLEIELRELAVVSEMHRR